MIKPVKSFVLLLTVPVLLLFHSCFVNPEVEVRTAELEKQELSETIGKLESEGYDIDTTASGLLYVIHKAGTGPFVIAGDTCFLEYATYFINGQLIDYSLLHYTDGIWQFVFKPDSLLPGLAESLQLMNKGTEADFILPSNLAYGAEGIKSVGIPEYTPLIFSLKLHDLKVKTE